MAYEVMQLPKPLPRRSVEMDEHARRACRPCPCIGSDGQIAALNAAFPTKNEHHVRGQRIVQFGRMWCEQHAHASAKGSMLTICSMSMRL